MSHYLGITSKADRNHEAARRQAGEHDALMAQPRWRKMKRATFIGKLVTDHGHELLRAEAVWRREFEERLEVNAEAMYDELQNIKWSTTMERILAEIEGIE